MSETPSINKQKQTNLNELPTSENRNAALPNNTEQTLTQEKKVNLENFEIIMDGEKTTSPTLKT